jgi:hypothetical protein
MNSNGVIKVFVLIVWSELNIDILADTRRNHSFLIILDLEIWGLRRQDVQSLWGWRVINQFDFESVGLAEFKACKFNSGGVRSKKTIRSNGIKFVGHTQMVFLLSLCFCEHSPLKFNGRFHHGFCLGTIFGRCFLKAGSHGIVCNVFLSLTAHLF